MLELWLALIEPSCRYCTLHHPHQVTVGCRHQPPMTHRISGQLQPAGGHILAVQLQPPTVKDAQHLRMRGI